MTFAFYTIGVKLQEHFMVHGLKEVLKTTDIRRFLQIVHFFSGASKAENTISI